MNSWCVSLGILKLNDSPGRIWQLLALEHEWLVIGAGLCLMSMSFKADRESNVTIEKTRRCFVWQNQIWQLDIYRYSKPLEKYMQINLWFYRNPASFGFLPSVIIFSRLLWIEFKVPIFLQHSPPRSDASGDLLSLAHRPAYHAWLPHHQKEGHWWIQLLNVQPVQDNEAEQRDPWCPCWDQWSEPRAWLRNSHDQCSRWILIRMCKKLSKMCRSNVLNDCHK